MKKFQYSLQTVLNDKNMVLDQKKEEYASWQAKIEAKNREIAALEQKKRDLENAFDDVKHHGAVIEKFLLFAQMIDGTDEEIKYQYKLLARLQKKADMKKKEVIAAHIDVSKFEKLKEKKLAEYRFAEQKENEAFIEEFVQNASARESGAGA